MEIGNTLKEARESRGISLETAEEYTKIRRKYLEALEEENFDILPGKVYVKGFIKNYAKFLKLNADELASAYESGITPEEREDEFDGKKLTKIEGRKGGGAVKLTIVLVAVVMVAALIYLPQMSGKDEAGPVDSGKSKIVENNKPAAPANPELNNESETLPEPPPAPQGVNVTLSVTDDRSWMSVQIDGQTAFTGTLSAGQVKEFKGSENVSLRLGNAGVVEVEFNGQKMGVLGEVGDVVDKEFNAPQA